MTASLRGQRRHSASRPQRLAAMDRHIRAHWGTMPVAKIAEIAGETYGSISARASQLGMPKLKTADGYQIARLGGIPSAPKGIPAATLAWARENAAVDREAAMILALTGRDVRGLGWR